MAEEKAPSRGRRFLQNAGLLAASSLLAILIGEVACRLLGLGGAAAFEGSGDSRRRSDAPGVRFEQTPGFEGIVSGAAVKINALGCRGPERPAAKAPGTIRILGTGDSIAFGYGLPVEETYLHRLEAMISDGGARSVEVLNAGVSGYTFEQQVAWVRAAGLALEPDIVLATFYVGNDAEMADDRIEDHLPLHQALGATWLSRSHLVWFVGERLGGLFHRSLGLRSAAEVVHETYRPDGKAWLACEANLHALSDLCAERGAGLVIAVFPVVSVDPTANAEAGYAFGYAHDRIRDALAARPGVVVVDLGPIHRAHADEPLALPDGHPNARSHELTAETLAAVVAPLLRDR